MFLGNEHLQGTGRGFWIGTDDIHVAAQVFLQLLKVGMGIDVRTEVHADTRITVDVVSVSLNHCPVGFGRVCPCRDVDAHGQPGGCIAVP